MGSTSPIDNLPPEIAATVNRTSAQIEQYAEVMDVLRLDKQNALVRRLVKKHQDGTLGQPATESGDPEEASGDDVTEDDTVHFGDTTHNTYTIHEPAQPLVAEKSSGSLLPIILASALGGGGLAAAAIALPALLKSDPAPVVVPHDADTDTNTNLQYRLEFADRESQP